MYSYPMMVQVYKGYGLLPGTLYLGPLYETFPFLIRGFTRQEYTEWQQRFPRPGDLEDHLLATCVVTQPDQYHNSSWDWNAIPAGIAQQILDKIFSLSGYGDQPDPDITLPVNTYLNSQEAKYDLLIMTAYNYKLEDLLTMDHQHWHQLIGLAQYKLEMMGIDTEMILDPDKAKKKSRRQDLMGGGGGANPVGAQPFGGPPRGAQHERQPMAFFSD
jgi:hypothetical protein